ncbi:MAG: hypothetical protein GC199_04470 [Alphaproteobacteria bacterium]|nr:hypothetical protein [Alphaproteobacteria bacterium]
MAARGLAVLLGFLLWGSSMAHAEPDAIAIAPLDEALTFARTADGRVIAVTSYEAGRVRGIDLESLKGAPSDDAIDLLARHGESALRAAIEAAAAPVDVAVKALDMPVRLASEHIAVGTNYREHAEESSVNGGPFLFPKYVAPTAARAPIPSTGGLLDYEVELCLVTLAPLPDGAPAAGGLILCNDVTDRATLLRKIDPSDPQSGKGFTSGKSAPGFLPVGDLFVVPRDLKAFAAARTLQLSVNGEERQRAPVSDWIWDLDEILAQARGRRQTNWDYWGGTARLPFDERGAVPARTLVLAGTPAGTVFNGPATSDYAWGVLDWLAGFCQQTIASHVVEAYIARTAAEGIYLKAGDRVSIRVDGLGALENLIEGPNTE